MSATCFRCGTTWSTHPLGEQMSQVCSSPLQRCMETKEEVLGPEDLKRLVKEFNDDGIDWIRVDLLTVAKDALRTLTEVYRLSDEAPIVARLKRVIAKAEAKP